MKELTEYVKTEWVNDETPVNESNMNNIENGIYDNREAIISLINEGKIIELSSSARTITDEIAELVKSYKIKKVRYLDRFYELSYVYNYEYYFVSINIDGGSLYGVKYLVIDVANKTYQTQALTEYQLYNHITNGAIHVTTRDKSNWNNKWSGYLSDHNLIFKKG